MLRRNSRASAWRIRNISVKLFLAISNLTHVVYVFSNVRDFFVNRHLLERFYMLLSVFAFFPFWRWGGRFPSIEVTSNNFLAHKLTQKHILLLLLHFFLKLIPTWFSFHFSLSWTAFLNLDNLLLLFCLKRSSFGLRFISTLRNNWTQQMSFSLTLLELWGVLLLEWRRFANFRRWWLAEILGLKLCCILLVLACSWLVGWSFLDTLLNSFCTFLPTIMQRENWLLVAFLAFV